MAELVDASDSKSGFRKKVQVRFLFWARRLARDSCCGLFTSLLDENTLIAFASKLTLATNDANCFYVYVVSSDQRLYLCWSYK